MSEAADLQRENQDLRERLGKLGEAALSINESLDFETVLQKVLDSARALTGARYGVIATRDDQDGLEAVLTSGTSGDEHQGLVTLSGGTRIFAHFMATTDPLRVDDWGGYASSAGLNRDLPIPVQAGMYAPIRHQGESVGVIFLGHDREDRQFSTADEETLVMFSSQAAMVIANARRYRDERRARGDLETLIDTSPVGVAVMDATTGLPKSLNREALRIAESLLDPGQTPGDLLGLVTVRRADGGVFSLSELPLTELLSAAETVRAEEIVMEVADGRSVTVLLNATPIRSDEGERSSWPW